MPRRETHSLPFSWRLQATSPTSETGSTPSSMKSIPHTQGGREYGLNYLDGNVTCRQP